MSNKARPPMTKPEEVIAWAEETRAGNGEAFTMLKKEEQLLIAKFILAMRDHIKTLQNNLFGKPDAPSKATHPQTAEATKAQEEETWEGADSVKEDAPPPPPKAEKPQDEETWEAGTVVDDQPDPTLKQTNMEYFKANNVSMTRAYQLYCTWRNCDPDNRTVFDDERKAWLKAAGFAFWLNLPHE